MKAISVIICKCTNCPGNHPLKLIPSVVKLTKCRRERLFLDKVKEIIYEGSDNQIFNLINVLQPFLNEEVEGTEKMNDVHKIYDVLDSCIIEEGALSCTSCSKQYLIKDSIVDFIGHDL
ncbi:hypothetical protein EDEG_03081 [Edhazardia aedis USNM 41457]|uniref:Trm112p-like protein n=1 Tax=Edhazardia aedis (strain USNM 41457) TaxID=1003232 RepID=J9DIQ9_EDHAE|nr:hypothetical protein EDEG_03081 [Edhazardia aedis USNM 41457]|eukprot:EJW02495.1 hypothetical protein EDEG_03081 [Edhazardia aedis USNM 41457]